MNNGSGSAVQAEVREAISLLRSARDALRRAGRKGEKAKGPDEELSFYAEGMIADVDVISSDLLTMLEGDEPPIRVSPIVTGRPWKEDGGGGFGSRALAALALCREAWGGADQNNAPRMEAAMAAIVRAWLETCGYHRAKVVRAVLTHDLGTNTAARLLEKVNALCSRDGEAKANALRLGKPHLVGAAHGPLPGADDDREGVNR